MKSTILTLTFLTGLIWLPTTGCTQNDQSITLHLRRDFTKTNATYGLRGNRPPLSWDQSLPLTDSDGDGVFSITVKLTASEYQTVEYKYLENETWEAVDNRVVVLRSDTTINDQYNVSQVLHPDWLPKIDAIALGSDFQLAKNALLALHPGLFRYRSLAEAQKFFAEIESRFSQSQSYAQAYLLFTELTAFFKCGHTFPNPSNQSALIKKVVFDQPNKLPFTFSWIDGKMVVLRDVSEYQLAAGTEIHRINGIPVVELLPKLLALAKADGDNNGKRISDLQITGFGKFEPFDIFLPLLLPPGPQGYTLAWGPDQQQAIFPTITREERTKRLAQYYGVVELGLDQSWRFEWLAPETAYLKLPHFATWKMKTDWSDFLDRAFDTVRLAAKHVVIDIRNNEGGNDAVIEKLVRFVAREQVVLPASEDRVRYQRLPESFRPYVSSWDNTYQNFSGKVRPQQDYFILKQSSAPRKLAAQSKAFRGKVWLLVNEVNSSATFYLANVLQQTALATLVGQTTGGSRQGLNGGQIVFLRLPHSGIEIDIPVIGTFYKESAFGGVVPDFVVKESLSDKLGTTDHTLKFVIDKIQN